MSCPAWREPCHIPLSVDDLLTPLPLDGEGHGHPLLYSCLENPMDRGAWQATVCEVKKSRTQLSDWSHTPFRFWLLFLSEMVAVHIPIEAAFPPDLTWTLSLLHSHFLRRQSGVVLQPGPTGSGQLASLEDLQLHDILPWFSVLGQIFLCMHYCGHCRQCLGRAREMTPFR